MLKLMTSDNRPNVLSSHESLISWLIAVLAKLWINVYFEEQVYEWIYGFNNILNFILSRIISIQMIDKICLQALKELFAANYFISSFISSQSHAICCSVVWRYVVVFNKPFFDTIYLSVVSDFEYLQIMSIIHIRIH